MKIYVVRNDDYVSDYFVHEKNAENERDRVNELCEEYKDDPTVNSTPVFVDVIETAD